ncbi:hypothetical protein [Microvirga sp. VF16]|uniref:hypothetical protein n=1 Tax=Microvirga sp. VF16 TaxID=2807101 RepID=UPI00193DC24B|nr:hypothetical protein [Microvirga sp. VF16]QRM34370.1 hypothetical protein JO965_34760 [Microvirga sp. VF16]
MEPSRPLAKKRLDKALERILQSGEPDPRTYGYSDLRKKLSIISQERRFMLFLYMKQNRIPHTADELAEATEDLKSTVIKNLHVFVAEGIVHPARNATTGVVRYTINEELLRVLSDLFQTGDDVRADEERAQSRNGAASAQHQ